MTDLRRRRFLRDVSAGVLVGAIAPLASSKAAQRPAPSPIKIGQIGVGHAHAGKLAVFRQSKDFEVVGIVEDDPQLRQQAQARDPFRDLPWMTREQLLNVPGLEAVLIETRVRDLLENAEACVEAGKHIHLDKPAGESLEDFKRILDTAQRRKLLVQMGYMYRYNPAIVLLRHFVQEGWLGEIFEVHAVMSKVVGQADRRKLAEYRGGMMFELGCHLIDLVVGILGKPVKVMPYAQHASSIDDDLADNMLAVLEYPRALATVKSTAMEVEGFARRHLVVCGSEGTFHIQPLDNPAARIALARERDGFRKGYQDVAFPKYTRYVDDAADMAQIIRGEKEPSFSYDHDWVVQNTLLQACGL